MEDKGRKETSICYESPHRIKKTMELLAMHIPDFRIVMARELTKKFEEFQRGSAKEVFESVKNRELKGEIVLLLHSP